MKEFIFKYKYLIFAAIVIIHFAFKFYKCGEAGLWYDECFSVQLAQKSASEIIRISMEEDPNPPLYGVLIHYWLNLFGDSEEGVRSLSVLASSLAAGVLFLLCLNFFNWQTSVFASLMFFTSNELYYYGLEARTYALIILFVLCSYYLYLSIIKRPTLLKAILFAVANACIFYSHFLACFVLIGELLLFPFFAFTAGRISRDNENLNFSVSAKSKVIIYLLSQP
ncbi:MAG: glycosyltransferase family 39 protein [Sphingobacteriaceae bacterium]|nr:glycosyltransferase family 39 protein [Sphingobacteriaceae bacterium]